MRTRAEIESAFASTEELTPHKRFFLVGIGGAGMSALALMLKAQGCAVAGSDSTPSDMTTRLLTEGIEVHLRHAEDTISPFDQVILSDAIDLKTNPEVQGAIRHGCSLYRRSQLLGWLLKDKKIIAVTGTHGKTTTTGMIGASLQAAGIDATIVVGAVIPEFGTSVVAGTSDYAVVEACEAYDSFHDLHPQVVVLTNLEMDHADFHGDYENLKASVMRFVDSIPDGGLLVYCGDDEGAKEIGTAFEGKHESYTKVHWPLGIPGEHNRLNAGAASAVWKYLRMSPDQTAKAMRRLESFHGAERRLQVLQDGDITVIDDYAHHPTEVAASLSAVRDGYPGRRLIAVFQPHLYSRTKDLIPQFAEALSAADHVVITDIYPAREAPIPGVSSARIAEKVQASVDYVPVRHLLPRFVAAKAQPGDVILAMGAGNISEFGGALIKELGKDSVERYLQGGMATLNIAVVYGGDSPEREVSLHSGNAVHSALCEMGHNAWLVDVSDLLLSKGDLSKFVGPNRPDVVFLAVHGTHAEDGAIQGLFELLDIPYTGSRLQASAMAIDKQATKTILEHAGLLVPKGQLVHSVEEEITVKVPVVVKPNSQGSTVGLSFVESFADLQDAVRKALAFEGGVLVEEWLTGMEISVPVLGDRVLPPVEITPVSGRYDFDSKYTPGATEEIVPARLPVNLIEKAQRQALEAHRALGCDGATRTDMIVVKDKLAILEVNTLPGMTPTSLLPNSARAAGIDFNTLVDWIVRDALTRHAAKA
ncbi:MAG: D-alanine--D-alanine ligase [Fimbriimonadaceae bacterium]|nr:D-alanine--D-alanine ligase [Fimbriimonadaceae bacterium]